MSNIPRKAVYTDNVNPGATQRPTQIRSQINPAQNISIVGRPGPVSTVQAHRPIRTSSIERAPGLYSPSVTHIEQGPVAINPPARNLSVERPVVHTTPIAPAYNFQRPSTNLLNISAPRVDRISTTSGARVAISPQQTPRIVGDQTKQVIPVPAIQTRNLSVERPVAVGGYSTIPVNNIVSTGVPVTQRRPSTQRIQSNPVVGYTAPIETRNNVTRLSTGPVTNYANNISVAPVSTFQTRPSVERYSSSYLPIQTPQFTSIAAPTRQSVERISTYAPVQAPQIVNTVAAPVQRNISVERPQVTYANPAPVQRIPTIERQSTNYTAIPHQTQYAVNIAAPVQNRISVERPSTTYPAPIITQNVAPVQRPISTERVPARYTAPAPQIVNTVAPPTQRNLSVEHTPLSYTNTTPLTTTNYVNTITPIQGRPSVERLSTAYTTATPIAPTNYTGIAAPIQRPSTIERAPTSYVAPLPTNLSVERPVTTYAAPLPVPQPQTNFLNTAYTPRPTSVGRTSTYYNDPLTQTYATPIPAYTNISTERQISAYPAPLITATNFDTTTAYAPQPLIRNSYATTAYPQQQQPVMRNSYVSTNPKFAEEMYKTPIRNQVKDEVVMGNRPPQINILDTTVHQPVQVYQPEIVNAVQPVQPQGEEVTGYHEFVSGGALEPWTKTETRPVTVTNYQDDGRGGVKPVSHTHYEDFNTTVYNTNGGVRSVRPVKTFRTYELGNFENQQI